MNKLALALLGFIILLLWVMNGDAQQRLNDCEKLDNQREVEYCKLSYLKGI